MTRTRRSIQKGVGFLQPVIEERFRKIEEYGKDYPGKPVSRLILKYADFLIIFVHSSTFCHYLSIVL